MKMSIGLQGSGGPSLGLEGTIGFGSSSSTECSDTKEVSATSSTTFNFPPNSCYGVLAMARASVLPRTQFSMLTYVSTKPKPGVKRQDYIDNTAADNQLCPVLPVLWANNLTGAEVFLPSSCDNTSGAYVNLRGSVERRLLLRDFVIAYQCNSEARLLRQFAYLGLCQECLHTQAADSGTPPGQERAPTRRVQRCTSNDTNITTYGPLESCKSSTAAAAWRAAWWLSLFSAVILYPVI